MPITIKVNEHRRTCTVSKSGVGFPQQVVEKTKWLIGDKIEVGFIPETRCLLFSGASKSKVDVFTLSYANKAKKTGGKIFCIAFIKNYLQAVIVLPKRKIIPIFLNDKMWRVALLLDSLE